MPYQHELLSFGPVVASQMYEYSLLSAGSAMALVAWDILLTLDDQVDYIWTGSCGPLIKWIYLFSRWFGLLSQIGLHIWTVILASCSNSAPVPVSTCEAFFIFEAVSFQLLQLCLDGVLILRICAVYHRRRHYIALALAIVFFEVLMSVITQAVSIPRSTVGGRCTITHTPATTLCLAIGMIVSQSVLFILICRGKYLLQPVARRSKLIIVIFRDGVIVFAAVICVGVLGSLYLVLNQVFINFVWPWMMVVPAVLTPRIILNMQMAAEPIETMVELTTHPGVMQSVSETLQVPTAVYDTTSIYEQFRDSP